ncbi:MAG TPA: T9SS type A sorting domain-containing protein, partial [Saprospiraceae bacterium]|nr:T9SS type A sorting domain-containing protein [Saprospiraceae bacterium]
PTTVDSTCTVEIIRRKDEVKNITYLCAVSKQAIKEIYWSSGEKDHCIIPTKTAEYCVKVKLANGCETRACVKYEAPTTVDSTCTVEIIRRKDDVKNINYLCVVSKIEIKKIQWNNGEDTNCIAPSKTGEYCAKILLANGCETSACISYEAPIVNDTCSVKITRGLTPNASRIPQLCFTANARVVYYEWSNGSKERCFTPTKAGEYCIKVQFANGCIAKECITIKDDATPEVCKIAITRIKRGNQLYLCAETNNPFHNPLIVWSDGSKGSCIPIKEAGRYCAQIVVNGCEARACVTIDSITNFSSIIDASIASKEETIIKDNPNEPIFKISRFGPNPVRETMFVDVYASMDHQATLQLFDMNGHLVTKKALHLLQGENTVEIDAQLMNKGIYQLQIRNMETAEYIKVIKME